MNPFPFVSLAMSVVFAILLFRKSKMGKSMPHLLWAVALALLSAAFLMESIAELYGWGDSVYRIYYAATPPAVGLMGAGSLLLISSWGNILTRYSLAVGVLLALAAASAVLGAPLGPNGSAMPSYVRLLSPLLTIPGSIALIGSAVLGMLRKTANRWVLLIALGGIAFASAGRLGPPYAMELLGLSFLFAGFLLTKRASK